MSNSTEVLNSYLDPKIHQVIGSTPAALEVAIRELDFKDKAELGFKFVALSVFAASVNKPTVEAFFMESTMADLRVVISRKFVLNSRPNMTALSLAGHCFLTIDEFSQTNYIREFRKKMGQNSIWDGALTSGSLSEKQRQIFQERAKAHSKSSAEGFARFFVSYTGAGRSNAGKVSTSDTSKKFPTDALATSDGNESTLDDKSPDINIDIPAAPDVPIPDDIRDDYVNLLSGNQESWNRAVAKYGIDRVVRNVKRKIQGDDTGSVAGV